MKRWLGNILAAVSLILCVGVCVLWVSTWREARALRWLRHQRIGEMEEILVVEFSSGKGRMALVWDRYYDYAPWMPGIAGGMYYQSWRRQTDDRILDAGWRKMFWGFGVMHDWPDEGTRKRHEMELAAYKKFDARGRIHSTNSYRAAWAPNWFLAGVLAVWPVRKVYVWRRQRVRRRRGLCLGCGYDLRGSGERCPECGEMIVKNTGGRIVPR